MAQPIPDRGHLTTEQRNPRSSGLHRRSVAELVALMTEEQETVLAAMRAAQPALTGFISAIEPGFLRGGRLVYLGAGTSGRLGVLDASEAPPTFCVPPERIIGLIAGGDGALRKSSEGREDEPAGAVADLEQLGLGGDDAVLGIAAGGTTPYALGALSWAKRLPAPPITGFLTCAPVPVPADCDHLIVLPTGAELLTGSTRMKAGTATKLALNTISTALMVRLGKVYDNLMVDVRASNVKLRDRAARIVAELTGLPRADCLALVESAGGSAKVAVVMARCGLSRRDAEQQLAEVDGRLDRLVG